MAAGGMAFIPVLNRSIAILGTGTMVLSPANNVVEQRNGTNAQTFRVYNTYTDDSNYERASLAWSGNVFAIAGQSAGTGAANRAMTVDSLGTGTLTFQGTATGHILFGTGLLWHNTSNALSIGNQTVATVADPLGLTATWTLQVYSNGNTTGGVLVLDTRTMAAAVGGAIDIGGYVTGTSAYGRFAQIAGTKENGTGGSYLGNLTLLVNAGTGNAYSNYREALRILSDGSINTGGNTTAGNGYGSINIYSVAVAGGNSALRVTPGAHTSVTAEVIDVSYVAHTMTITGNYATQRFVNFASPTVTSSGAQTITTVIAHELNGPLPAGSTTFTNSVTLNLPTYATNGTTASTLRVAAPTGAATNWAINVTTGASNFQAMTVNGTLTMSGASISGHTILANGGITAASGVIAFAVVSTAFTLGSAGSVVIPYADMGNAANDAARDTLAGNINGAVAVDSVGVAGTYKFWVRANSVWKSVTVA